MFFKQALVVCAALFAIAVPATAVHEELKQIKHIVLFMQENRAFDHYFGTMAGVRGFQDPNVHISKNTGKNVFHQPVNRSLWDDDGDYPSSYYPPKNVTEIKPWHITYQGGDYVERTQCMVAGTNDWRQNHNAWNKGEMDMWAMANTPFSLGYYRRDDIPTMYSLAGNFTVADHYYESIMSSTDPNRISWFSGTINVNGSVTGGGGLERGGPVIDNNDEPKCLVADNKEFFSCRPLKWKTVPEYMFENNITFQFYQDFDNFGDNTLVAFKQYQEAAKKKTELAKRAVSYVGFDKFVEDAKHGTLPEVSVLVAPMQLSEHPPYTPKDGEYVQAKVANAVMNGKNWNSTVLFYSYDETGGLADHVVGPMPPEDAQGEWMVDPYDKKKGKVPTGPGFRVPFYAVSPWTRNGGVFTEHAAHESQILFLEEWAKAVGKPFHTKEMNPWRRAQFSNLVNMLDFSHHDSSVLKLDKVPEASKDPITGEYNGADVCALKFRTNVQPTIPYNHTEAQSLRVEDGYKPVRGNLTEGHYLTFEVNGKALSHENSRLTMKNASSNHDGKDLRFVLSWQGKYPKDNKFYILTGEKQHRKYITSSLKLSSDKKHAASFSLVDLGNGQGHVITNTDTNKKLVIEDNGDISMKDDTPIGINVFSATFNE